MLGLSFKSTVRHGMVGSVEFDYVSVRSKIKAKPLDLLPWFSHACLLFLDLFFHFNFNYLNILKDPGGRTSAFSLAKLSAHSVTGTLFWISAQNRFVILTSEDSTVHKTTIHCAKCSPTQVLCTTRLQPKYSVRRGYLASRNKTWTVFVTTPTQKKSKCKRL